MDSVRHNYILSLANNVMDSVAAQKQPYRFVTPLPALLPLYNRMDDAGAMYTAISDKNKKDYSHFEFMHGLMITAASAYRGAEDNDPESQAAYHLLKKHFSKLALIARYWYNDNDRRSCDEVDWINKNMAKYFMDAEGTEYITKRIKECKKKVCGYCFY